MIERVFDFICKNCWHMWKKKMASGTKLEKVKCPKCGSEDIDSEYYINF